MSRTINPEGGVYLFIDGVFSGGGVKGFALIGAIMELEDQGYRFKRMAGTSAGAIIAGFIAAGYSGAEIYEMMKSVKLTTLLESKKSRFPFARWLKLYWSMGLFKGDALEIWIKEILAKRNIRTFNDLPDKQLRIIASDLTNGTIMVLPDDLPKYNIDPNQFSVARAIRMSCSIPFFFQPIILRTVGEKKIVVDGGVLSNFPMWLFDYENVMPERPVLGLKLIPEKQEIPVHEREIDNAFELFTSLFETMRNAHDARYISRKFVKNIVFIPVKETGFIEFSVTDEQRQALINEGKRASNRFLRDWKYRIR